SFPDASTDPIPLVFHHHTPQTTIYYPLHLPTTYPLIHQNILQNQNSTKHPITQTPTFNLPSLQTLLKIHQVPANLFYFFPPNHPYH
ncbi:DUF1444 family protein, partial [Bacillus sp. WP8]|uniref:DUF1444 family protein n=1 Tax=Bacillus sp. WP8 TaxID=756828 RepID=UPI001C92E00A